MSSSIPQMGGLSPLPPTAPPAAAPPAPSGATQAGGVGPSFAEALQQSTGGVQFSKHALERLQRRNIGANTATIRRLERGVDMAARKNARDAVVMVDNTAFVVSVKNRTVITAIDAAQMRDHVFTNIDSAVVA
ncbi:MAG TPA: TIGR02530 family flagellar biosynthesis protein [Solirubrobacterales bacterium]